MRLLTLCLSLVFGTANAALLTMVAIKEHQPNITWQSAGRIALAIHRNANSTVSPELLFKVIAVESNFNYKAINPYSGAVGLGQVLPSVHAPEASRLNLNLLSVDGNVTMSSILLTRYIQQQKTRDGGLRFYYGAGSDDAAWRRYQRKMNNVKY